MNQYPDSPGFKEKGDTSEQAAIEMEPRQGRLKKQILAVLQSRDLTPDEAAEILGESVLAIRPRFSELYLDNLIEPNGEKRLNHSGKNAKVWRLTPPEKRLHGVQLDLGVEDC